MTGAAAIAWAKSPRVLICTLLAALAAVGVVLRDDYGVSQDDAIQRQLGHATLDHALGDEGALSARLGGNYGLVRFYGAVFEAPLALLERVAGLTDSHDIHLARHLLTHLVFLAGAGFAGLLVLRLFGSAWLAAFALAVFALHPRLYAHSFFNTKDAPFAALFMVCLLLTHRAFTRGNVGAFALLGVGVGALINLRVMGVLLAALVVVAKAPDLASSPARRRALIAVAAFAATGLLTLYAVSPHLWSDPLRLGQALATLSHGTVPATTLFQGDLVAWPEIPARYAPTWVAITTPAAALVLALAGAAAAAARAVRAAEASAAGAVRFGALLVACPVLAVAGVVAVDANIYNGWRHLYFLWAPLGLLAVFGCKWLGGATLRPALRRGGQGLAAAGFLAAVAQAAAMHPQQALYFNFVTDRDTPERLGTFYELDSLRMAYHGGLREVLKRHPSATVDSRDHRLRKAAVRGLALDVADRRRFVFDGPVGAADLVLDHFRRNPLSRPDGGRTLAPTVYALGVYDNTLLKAIALDVSLAGAAMARAWRAAHSAAAAGAPVARSTYALHWGATALTWLKAPCGAGDARGEFAFTAWPVAGDGPPAPEREGRAPQRSDAPAGVGGGERAGRGGGPGAQEFACDFAQCGVRVAGACLVYTPLPPHPLKAIDAGQRLRNGPYLWRVGIDLSGAAAVAMDRPVGPLPAAGAVPLPAEAPFDFHLDGRTLVYVREPCRAEDTEAPFFLHVLPVDPDSIPAHRRPAGFENLDFEMERYDAGLLRALGGRCVASARLPDYPIAALRTGQLINWGRLWTATLKHPAAAAGGQRP